MNKLQKNVVIISLSDQMKAKGSWCGETHIQKSCYFLQELMNVPLNFEFILYKHGPYSFDLSDELTAMRANGLIALQLQPFPYGPSMVSTQAGRQLMQRFSRTSKKYSKEIDFISTHLGGKNVAELEKLATALYITLRTRANREVRSRILNKTKPHISLEDAKQAIESVDEILHLAFSI